MSNEREPSGGVAGVGAALRLDPRALPVRYETRARHAQGEARLVDLHADRVVIRRAMAGVAMKIQVPIRDYRGVGLAIGAVGAARVELLLVHRDPGFTVPLFQAADDFDVVAEWQMWGKRLGLALLAPTAGENGAEGATQGDFEEATRRLGGLLVEAPAPRRRRRSSIAARRPRALVRRKPGGPLAGRMVHREREIIARD